MKPDKEKYIGKGTKVSPDKSKILDAICEALGTDIYHILQRFLDTLIRAAAEPHTMSPGIQKIMTLMDIDANWQNAFNHCNPDGLDVAQVILILHQKGKDGYGAVMIDKAVMPGEEPRQTENVDDILERVTEVCMHGIYRRLRMVGAHMQCENLSDILLTMIDRQMTMEMEEENMREMQGRNDIADNGKVYAYGRKTKSKHHRTPDSVDRQTQIVFDDYDRNVSDYEVADWEGEHKGGERTTVEESLGCKPFTEEP